PKLEKILAILAAAAANGQSLEKIYCRMQDSRNILASLLSTTGPMFSTLRRISSIQSLNSGASSSIGWVTGEYFSKSTITV
ncbi:11633_t:CDS:2, partial [Funneliformis geosporum]